MRESELPLEEADEAFGREEPKEDDEEGGKCGLGQNLLLLELLKLLKLPAPPNLPFLDDWRLEM